MSVQETLRYLRMVRQGMRAGTITYAGAWDESKHPRASDGRFGTVAGSHAGKEETTREATAVKDKPKKKTKATKKSAKKKKTQADHEADLLARVKLMKDVSSMIDYAMDMMREGLSFVDEEMEADFSTRKKDIMGVASHMNRRSLELLVKNCYGTVMYPTVDYLSKKHMSKAQYKTGSRILGLWTNDPGKADGTLHLDGHFKGHWNNTQRRGTFAHEFGHAIDGEMVKDMENHDTLHSGPGKVSSGKTKQWREAWEKEINQVNAPLSTYARTNPWEGFAEFARLVWCPTENGKLASPRKMYPEIKKKFPLCWKYWVDRGYLDDTEFS